MGSSQLPLAAPGITICDSPEFPCTSGTLYYRDLNGFVVVRTIGSYVDVPYDPHGAFDPCSHGLGVLLSNGLCCVAYGGQLHVVPTVSIDLATLGLVPPFHAEAP